jgi:hypothetical protein
MKQNKQKEWISLLYTTHNYKKMSLTPPQNRGMVKLNKDAFKATFTVLAIRTPNTLVKQFTTVLEK